MRRDSTAKKDEAGEESGRVRGARLEPIRVVVRELTRPDGKKMRVEVPVYPPFRLEDHPVRSADGSAERAPEKSEPGATRPRKQAKPRRA